MIQYINKIKHRIKKATILRDNKKKIQRNSTSIHDKIFQQQKGWKETYLQYANQLYNTYN